MRLIIRLGLLSALILIASTARGDAYLWQTNSQGSDIHIFTLSDFQLHRVLDVGSEPHGIAVPDDGRVVYVSVERNGEAQGELLWIDPATLTVQHRLAVGPEPHAIATTPDGKWIYVPCRDGHYWVVDGDSQTVVTKIKTGGRPHNTQASRDGRWMFLSPMGKPKGVTVVDVQAGHQVVGFIPFADSVRPSALSADGRWFFQHIDGLNGFQVADVENQEIITTVTHSSKLGWFMPIKRLGYWTLGGLKRCHGLAITPNQQEIWSVCAENLAVHQLDGAEFPETDVVELPGKGYWLTFSPDGRYGFIALSDRNAVAVYDVETKKFVQLLHAGQAPKRNLVIEVDDEN